VPGATGCSPAAAPALGAAIIDFLDSFNGSDRNSRPTTLKRTVTRDDEAGARTNMKLF
jgi:hypothetical protein